jgi:hypothetical protein
VFSLPSCCCLQVFAGLLVGAMLPYWFSAMTMKSVGKAALAMPHTCSNLLVKLLSNLLLLAGVCWSAGWCHASLLVQRHDHEVCWQGSAGHATCLFKPSGQTFVKPVAACRCLLACWSVPCFLTGSVP